MKNILLITALLLLSACASEPAKLNHYLLRDNVTSESSGKIDAINIALNSVQVATYIDQKGLVLETNEGQINMAKHHLWAEPLRHSLVGFLSQQIGKTSEKHIHPGQSASSDVTTLIDVTINQLHGNNQGQAVLDATWKITQLGESASVTNYRYADIDTLTESGYAALVNSEKRLLEKLAAKIAASL